MASGSLLFPLLLIKDNFKPIEKLKDSLIPIDPLPFYTHRFISCEHFARIIFLNIHKFYWTTWKLVTDIVTLTPTSCASPNGTFPGHHSIFITPKESNSLVWHGVDLSFAPISEILGLFSFWSRIKRKLTHYIWFCLLSLTLQQAPCMSSRFWWRWFCWRA